MTISLSGAALANRCVTSLPHAPVGRVCNAIHLSSSFAGVSKARAFFLRVREAQRTRSHRGLRSRSSGQKSIEIATGERVVGACATIA
jgi:hypothetical protein